MLYYSDVGAAPLRFKCFRALLVSAAWLLLAPSVRGMLPVFETSYTMPAGVTLQDGQEFEYIVVGAGAGGSVAAARLALAGARVLLLEAGGDPGPLTRFPGTTLYLLGSDLDWRYRTVSNNMSCLSSVRGQCRFARGKCLGGSTSINHMLYARGNRQDFDDIGVPGWNYTQLLPYFLRAEGLQDLALLPRSSLPYHNISGPLQIQYFADSGNAWHERLISAYGSLQFPLNPDVNGESQIGVSQLLGYVHDGERVSTARAYLSRRDVKRSLRVAKNTVCTGVIIDEDKTARGVTAVQAGRTLRLRATREVVLSAGSVATPQILMLSGVGPAEHLAAMGIPVKANLPVGDNMSDHTLPLMIVQVDKGGGLHDGLKQFSSIAENLAQLLTMKQGPLTSNGLTDVTAFLNTDCYDFEQRRLVDRGPRCQVPNLQFIHSYIDRQALTFARDIFQNSVDFDDDIIDQISRANEDYALLVVCPILLHPESRGRIRLASADPLAPPSIFPNYLSTKWDLEQMVKSMRIVEHVVGSAEMSAPGARLLRPRLAGCPRRGEGYWRCYARHMTIAAYHTVGTSALGRVLDERLRVRGVRGLRVADASAMPTVPRASTEAMVVAIAERLVDFLREDDENLK